MKWNCLTLLLMFWCYGLSAQKKQIDHKSYMDWPKISDIKICNDGKYIVYLNGSENWGRNIVIQATNNSWKKEISDRNYSGNVEYTFTEDSKRLIFSKSTDSLGILELSNGCTKYISKIASWKTPQKGDGRWLAYSLKDSLNSLVIMNLATNEEKKYTHVENYIFSSEGKIMIILQNGYLNNKENHSIIWQNLDNGIASAIDHGFYARDIIFNDAENMIVFLAEDKKQQSHPLSIRYFKTDMDASELMVNANSQGMNGMEPVGIISVSKGSDKVFFYIGAQSGLTKRAVQTPIKGDIWNYKDDNATLEFENPNAGVMASYNIKEKRKVTILKHPGDGGNWFDNGDNDNYILLENGVLGSPLESELRVSARPNIYLVSTNDGKRTLIKKRLFGYCTGFSVMGKYIIWYDKEKKQWFTYNIKSKTVKNISYRLHVPIVRDEDHPRVPSSYDVAGWLSNDKAVLIYDEYDIWKLDPDGKAPPFNITKGYGRKNQIQLRMINLNVNGAKPIIPSDTLVLSAFNLRTKQNGIFKLTPGREKSVGQLVMENKVCYFPFPHDDGDFSGFDGLFFPLKAQNANTYIFRPMSAVAYPNICVTKDFKYFKPLTAMEPQRAFNWYTTEHLYWKLPGGNSTEGILYKPENFDPHKKYPLIFYIYERDASFLNVFLYPQPSNGRLNIPWFTSNGYLVLVPDIYYQDGYPGKSALNSVVSAIHYISKFSWFDRKHLGLQGHSFGGFETNYIVTHTTLFAAAAPAASTSNIISAYNKMEGTVRGQSFYESGQGRIGATLWERPDLYIENSPIFRANKVTTPLLILHNKKDGNVYFSQGLEWYSALNSLNKKVWMLSYDEEYHTIEQEKNQLDYSIRLGQFFDYYLKGTTPPFWMTRGRQSWLKGKESGLEPDTSGARP